MSTAEEEERVVNSVFEASASCKSTAANISLKVPHSNSFAQSDSNELPESTDPVDLQQSLGKSNVFLQSNKVALAKFVTHNGDDSHNDELGTFGGNVESGDLEERDFDEKVTKPTIPRIILTPEQLSAMTKDELIDKWNQQETFIESLQLALNSSLHQVNELRQRSRASEERLKAQLSEIQKKEQYHIMRLTSKEHDIQELATQVEELKSLSSGSHSLKHSLLDPAVNLLLERIKRDFDAAKTKMEETQNELAAWKFTPDSNMGKQLMAKCRLLIRENEELGKVISSGRFAKLEGDLALQRNFSDELKNSQSDLEELLQEMDEDTEGMQGTILFLQSELREAKETIAQLSSASALPGVNVTEGESTSLSADPANAPLRQPDGDEERRITLTRPNGDCGTMSDVARGTKRALGVALSGTEMKRVKVEEEGEEQIEGLRTTMAENGCDQ